jgi:hypothetical protein
MKTIIAGSRDLSIDDFIDAIEVCPLLGATSTVVSGTARGIDRFGEEYAEASSLNVVRFPADWARYNMGAGKIRNKQMAEFSDALMAVWDGKSPGTKNMIAEALHLDLIVWVWDASIQEGYYECS